METKSIDLIIEHRGEYYPFTAEYFRLGKSLETVRLAKRSWPDALNYLLDHKALAKFHVWYARTQ
jgi:hypothetical protein